MIINQNIDKLYNYYRDSSGVSIDTRTILENQIFFALLGPNFNGNKFIDIAINKGAKLIVSDDKSKKNNPNVFFTDNVLLILQQLATYYRQKFDIPIIAITGSNGKTTTKTLLNNALSTKYKTHATYKNLNNHLGVPLTLLSMPKDTQIAIIEMGANKCGDIKELCNIAHPTHGVITNIGYAHTKGFEGINGVIKGKTELYNYLVDKSNIIFVNENNKILYNHISEYKNIEPYNINQDITIVKEKPFLEIENNEKTYKTNMFGNYNLENIATAIAIAKHFEVPIEQSCDAIKNYIPKDNRSQWIEKNGNNILLDAYNANPTSIKAALDSFLNKQASDYFVILGEMKEVDNSIIEHKQIGEHISQYTNIKTIIYIGKKMKHAYEITKNNIESYIFNDTDTAISDYFSDKSIFNSTIFIKGSRAMELEKIVDYL